jgi:hypothetical protein
LANILKNFVSLFSSRDRPQPDEDGFFPVFSFNTATPQFNDVSSDLQKNKIVFESAAVLKVFCLQCDLFSLGKIKVFQNDKEIEDDIVIELLENPNPMQGGSQLLWDYMFNLMKGNAYGYIDSDIPSVDNKIYFLEASKIEWPRHFEIKKDKLIFSKKSYKEFQDTNIVYRYEDGTSITLPLSKIMCIPDLTNGSGNWYKGNSRIDGLKKIISNSEAALDAININTRYTGKFLVAGQQDPKDVSKLPMSQTEKEDIEKKTNGPKQVHAVKSMVEIKRFVENIGTLKLDESFRTAYFLIGSMYGIPKDVLEAYLQGSTFDNQEKATAKHITYTMQPKGDAFMDALEKRFGYKEQGKQIKITWDHLPFMQVFEKDRANVKNTQVQTMTAMLKLGIDIKEINEFLGTNFKKAVYEQPKVNTGGN